LRLSSLFASGFSLQTVLGTLATYVTRLKIARLAIVRITQMSDFLSGYENKWQLSAICSSGRVG
jgi:hypothetical protein